VLRRVGSRLRKRKRVETYGWAMTALCRWENMTGVSWTRMGRAVAAGRGDTRVVAWGLRWSCLVSWFYWPKRRRTLTS
jgi:hypothetical protein